MNMKSKQRIIEYRDFRYYFELLMTLVFIVFLFEVN